MNPLARIKANLGTRPHWMNAILLFCGYMTFIYVPWDLLLKPLAEDQEVWFGLLFTGWAAKIGAVLHWLVYGFGFYGFLYMKKWLHPWALVYVLQIAFSMAIWGALAGGSGELTGGLMTAVVFIVLAYFLWRQRSKFAN
ncbi:MAG: hypothetical protein RL120_14595 [Gammaproteobacteria bacterium]